MSKGAKKRTAKAEEIVAYKTQKEAHAVEQVVRPKAQIVIRHERGEVCGRCGAQNAFRQAEGMRARGTVRVAAARCRKCGALAQIKLIPCTDRPFIKRGAA